MVARIFTLSSLTKRAAMTARHPSVCSTHSLVDLPCRHSGYSVNSNGVSVDLSRFLLTGGMAGA